MLAHYGTVERSNADGYRCKNSTLVNILTRGQGGAIPSMQDTRLQELKKIVNETNREGILWFSESCSDLRSQIAKN